jgi:hypothetical protein
LKQNPVLLENNGMINDNLTFEVVKESVACVYVFFGELKYTEINENPSLSFIGLLSNIGGSLGLFAGLR